MKLIYPLVIFCFLWHTNYAQPGFIWAKQIGGPLSTSLYSMAKDEHGDLYIAGSFQGTVDFDPGPNVYNLTSVDGTDAFICKLDSAGNFLFAKQIGGLLSQAIHSIKIDLNKSIYTTGFNYGTADFDPGTATYNLTTAGETDIFISKLDSLGNFLWAKQIGGPGNPFTHTGNDKGKALDVTPAGMVYITGSFSDTVDFDPSPGVYNLCSNGNRNNFICKFNSSGNLIWAKNTGGVAYEIVLDNKENILLTGNFNAPTDFDPGTGNYYVSPIGNMDLFILKLDSSANLQWIQQMGGPGVCSGTAVTLDVFKNIYLTGVFGNTIDFDPGAGVNTITSGMNRNGFVCKLDSAGGLLWASGIIGQGECVGTSIGVDINSNVYSTGFFTSNDFDPGPSSYTMTSNGFFDVYIQQLDPLGNFVCAGKMGGPGPYNTDAGKAVLVDNHGCVYIGGEFQSSMDFDPGVGTYSLNANSTDAFVSKYKICGKATGLNENEKVESCLIYPNPSSGKFHITSSDHLINVTINNMLGEEVYLRNNVLDAAEFDLSSQPKGIYIISIGKNGKYIYEKLVKE